MGVRISSNFSALRPTDLTLLRLFWTNFTSIKKGRSNRVEVKRSKLSGRSTEKFEDIKMVEVQKSSKIWKWSKYRKVRRYENGRSTEKFEDIKMVEVQKSSKIWKWSKYRKVRRYENGRSTEKVELVRTH